MLVTQYYTEYSIDGTTLATVAAFVWLTRIVTAEKRLIRATTLLSRVGDISVIFFFSATRLSRVERSNQ